MKAVFMATATTAALLLPAVAEAKTGSIYDITFAKGSEKVTFTGDAADCAQFAVCGYDGTVEYTIGGKPKGKIVLTRTRAGRVDASARYSTSGVTESSVTPPADGTACSDTVARKNDVFSLTSSGPKLQSLLLAYHDGASQDYLETTCPGPTEADVRAADALPEGIFRSKDFFRGKKPKLSLGGSTPFTRSGFRSTIEWSLEFKAKQRACSPRCKLPAG
jgi:hypothetical protein